MKTMTTGMLPLLVAVTFLSACSDFDSKNPEMVKAIENKKIAVSYIEDVVNGRNLELIHELFSTEYISHDRQAGDVSTVKDGSLISFLEYLFQAFPDLHYTIVHAIAEGDTVALDLRAEGTHRNEFLGFEASGNVVRYHEMFFFRLAGGKIVEGWSLVDFEEVKKQLNKITGK